VPLTGLRAPAWLEALAHTERPPVPWRDVVRFAVTIPAPLAVAIAVDGGVEGSTAALGAGVFATTGALAATLAPQGGPLRTRLRRTAAASGFGAVGLVVGQAATGGGWGPVLVIALLSAVAAFFSSVNAVFSLGALQLLVYTALSSGLVTPLPAWAEVAWFAVGTLWATLTMLVQARTEQQDPDRAAVAGVFTAIATLLDAIGPSDTEHTKTEEARRALTAALNDGYDRVIHTRARTAGRSQELSELAGVLNAAAPLVEGAVAAARAGVQPCPADVAAARSLASAITGDTELGWERPPSLAGGPAPRRAVRHGIRLVWNVVGDEEERALAAVPRVEPDLRERSRDLLERTLSNPESRSFAVRLALCMGIAEVARQVLPIERPYWVLLTVALVLKPDFGSVFTRAVHRGAGTLLGVLIGSALLELVPRGGWIVLAMAVAAGLMPWGRNANFGLFSVFQTPVVIMLLDLAAPSGADLVGARLVDTLIGCAIVLVFGYLLWPQTWRAPLDDALRQVTQALDVFLQQAVTGTPEETRRARRATYRALTDVQTQLQRRLAEPPPISTRAAAWWPVIVQLERVADAVTGAVIGIRAGEPVPETAQVDVVRRAVRQLEEDVRAHRVPDDAELFAEGVLAPVAREVDTTRRMVRRSAPGRWADAG
jgi:uncharacterized membrane protein YccC